jgi:uncharacterized membrane protein
VKKTTTKVTQYFRRPRLITSAILGAALFFALLPSQPAAFAFLVAFDISVAIFLGLISHVMNKSDESTMRRHAKLQDENKWLVLLVGLLATGAVVVALSNELHAAKTKSLGTIALAGITILLAWLFVAVLFAQQYAHDFYMRAGHLTFPGTDTPDYWDFTYFSVVISMCFQTSDVVVNSGSMRRLVLFHSVISFFFNVVIIAMSVSIVASVV